jgi:MarR family transcriptional repressor of emrRAB
LKVAHRLPAGRCGLTAAENAAVIVIGHAPTMSIDQLILILRLSQVGTVRLVDRLVERNLVEKRPSALDRRIMSLALTTGGWQQRDKLLALRRAALTVLLNQVAPEDLAALEHVAETIAAALPEDAGVRWRRASYL